MCDRGDDGERPGWYSFERLEVYRLAVEFRRIVKQIVETLPHSHQADAVQLVRSATSSVRNICEAAGEFRPREKARFYRMSLRSSEESGGTLRILEDDLGPNKLYSQAHAVNYKLIAKLTVLCKNKGRGR